LFFDLILATIHRKAPLFELVTSLRQQTHPHFRILLVDQNPPGFLDSIIAEFQSKPQPLQIVHLRCQPGLSAARNAAIPHLSGDAVALVDDDSTFAPDTLSRAATALCSCDVAIGSLLPPTPLRVEKSTQSRRVATVRDLFRSAPSATIFFRRSVLDTIGMFDETLGAGAGTPFGSGEETDYLIRTFRAGFHIHRHPEIRVFHPSPDFSSPEAAQKARSYGRGRHHVIQKHDLGTCFLIANALHTFLKYIHTWNDKTQRKFWREMTLGRLGL